MRPMRDGARLQQAKCVAEAVSARNEDGGAARASRARAALGKRRRGPVAGAERARPGLRRAAVEEAGRGQVSRSDRLGAAGDFVL